MGKKIFIFLTFVFFIFPGKILAADFATSYDVVYDVEETGITTVTEKVTLRNLTSESYASKFKLTIGATEITDIKASDPGGALQVVSSKQDNLTSIEITFNQQVAGIGKELPWTLSFKTRDFAEKVGKVWEVRTPKVAGSDSLESYNLTLAVPLSFGEPSQISPAPKSASQSMGKLFMIYDKEGLNLSGISANFGMQQLFDFDLTYNLENTALVPILTTIALPPDTAYQDVIFQRIEPKPVNVTIDTDGNYLAWYKLARGAKLEIRVTGSSKLYAGSKVKNPFLPGSLWEKYSAAQKFWEKDNPAILSKLDEILSGKTDASTVEKARLIYQYVVDTLKYDPDRLKEESIERLGAITALNNPESAVCMEFTDLFIALARAAGIPARELNGYAYTSNPALRPLTLERDLLHAWPEYWDENRGWVMIDPTWGNTTGGVDYFNKFDLNHFVFTVRGSDSRHPIPAGSYKFDGVDSRDVKVILSDKDFMGKPQLDVEMDLPDPVISGFPNSLSIKLTNNGNAVYPSDSLNISAQNLTFDSISGQTGVIPAFGSAEFNFKIRTESLFDSYDDQVTVLVGDKQFSKGVRIRPFIIFRTVPLILAGVVALMVLIYLLVLGGHFYRFRLPLKKK